MRIFIALVLLFIQYSSFGQNTVYRTINDVPYTTREDAYSKEKNKLDFCFPQGKKDFVTLVWFHGGGLTGGDKELPQYLLDKGIAVIGVGYRLSPNVKVAEIIDDAADAVKWAFDHVEKYGGSKHKIIIGGHSAGAYLALMVGLNASYLDKRNVKANDLMGIAALSGQAITHYTARSEVGIAGLQPTINELAPLFWVRKDAPKILLITGDRELELMGRYEENAYLMRMLQLNGHQDVELYELPGYGHDMTYPAFPIVINTLNKWSK